MLRCTAMGFALGSAVSLALVIVSFLTPVADKWRMIGFFLPAAMILCGAGGAMYRVRDRDAARTADACGLQERTVTALETLSAHDDGIAREMRDAQLQDTCDALEHLDLKKIRPGSVRLMLVAGLITCGLCAASLLIPNVRDQEAMHDRTLREQLSQASTEIDAAAKTDESAMNEKEAAALRRLTEELKRELVDSRDEVDALVAVDRAEKRLEEIRQTTAADAMQALANALQAAGLDTLAGCLGDEQALAEALSGMDAETAEMLEQVAEDLSGAAREAAQAMTSSRQTDQSTSGNGQQNRMEDAQAAASQTVRTLQSGSTGATQQALQQLKSAMNGTSGTPDQSGSSGQSGTSGQSGAGEQSGRNEQSGGAGTGSSNLEHQPTSGSNSGGKGNNPPGYREGKYETIYDPERAEVLTREETTEQHAGEGDSVQVQIGEGKGTLEGDVPYGTVLREYADSQTRSAERENLTPEQRTWVAEYYRLLTEDNGQ